MGKRTLEQWLTHQAQTHPQTIDLGLDRMRELLGRLGWRQPDVPVITVAGTNGKGSVTAYCAAMLAAAGHRVGTFTSPHLRDYRERIRIEGTMVSSEALVEAFERIEAACAGGAGRSALSLTFFEYNALAAFLLLDAAQLDVWVLEVGLGGRLDAVNIIEPTVAVVVSIGFDHQEYLGTTLDAIAREKAGIFRAGRPAIVGARDVPATLVETARAVVAVVKRLGHEYDYTRHAQQWAYRGTRRRLDTLPPPALAGAAQYANAAAAIAALEELDSSLSVPDTAIATGLRAVRLPGRYQVIAHEDGPDWILDVAHNPAAARVLAQNLRAAAHAGRTLGICGILKDKDAAGIAAELRDCLDAWWLAGLDGVRGSSGAALAERIDAILTDDARRPPVPITVTADIAAACTAAHAAARAQDRIVVFGSFHSVGPALDWLESQGLLPGGTHLEYTAAPRG